MPLVLFLPHSKIIQLYIIIVQYAMYLIGMTFRILTRYNLVGE